MANVYEMMMKIGLSGGALADLAIVSERLTRIHRLSEQITSSFSRWHTALVGVGGLLAGTAILGGLTKLIEHTAKYSDELVKLKRIGPEVAEAIGKGEIQKRAFAISKEIPMSVVESMKLFGSVRGVVSTEESLKIWKEAQAAAYLMKADKDFKGDPAGGLQDLIRAGLISGRITDTAGNIDLDKFKKFMDISAQFRSATHGRVSPAVQLALSQQAGFTLRSLTDEGYMTELLMAQIMGGHRAGTSYMALRQQMSSGQMRTRTAKGMEEIGLLKSGEWTSDKGGGVILSDTASKRLSKLVSGDPLDLIDNIDKYLQSQGITEKDERDRRIMRAFGRQTTQRMIGEMEADKAQIKGERERAKLGMTVAPSVAATLAESTTANMDAFKRAWENLQFAVAGEQSPAVISFLKQLTSIIHSMTDAVSGMAPETLASIGKGIFYLGVGLTGAGAAAILLAIGPAGWLIGGLAALAVALTDPRFQTWLASSSLSETIGNWWTTEWSKFKTDLASMPSFNISGWFDSNITDPIMKWLGSHSIAAAIGSWFDQIGESARNSMGKWLKAPLIGPQKQSFEGDGPFHGMGRVIPASFNPSNNQKQILQPIKIDLNMDGRTLAQAVSEVLEDLYNHPTGAPSPNGWGKFRPQGNMSDT